MGNDPRFVEAEDLPFRLVEIPIGSAPPPPSPPIQKSHTMHKRHAPPIPPPRFDGYDAPPSLPPPPIPPKRFDQPVTPTVPPRSDLPSSHKENINTSQKKPSKKIKYSSKKMRKANLACCVIS